LLLVNGDLLLRANASRLHFALRFPGPA
jgi:hypothetical protein